MSGAFFMWKVRQTWFKKFLICNNDQPIFLQFDFFYRFGRVLFDLRVNESKLKK